MILVATLFGKLDTVKHLVRPLSIKHRFRTPFFSKHVKRPKLLQKEHESTVIMFFRHSDRT